MAKSNNTVTTKLNFVTQGLDKIQDLHKNLSSNQMSKSMRDQLDSLSNRAQSAIKEAQSRYKEGKFDTSDLGLDKIENEVQSLQRRIVGSLKGKATRENEDMKQMAQQIKKLQEEYKTLKERREEAFKKMSHSEVQKQGIAKQAGFDSPDVDKMTESLRQKEEAYSKKRGAKQKEIAQKEITNIRAAIKAVQEKNQEIEKYSKEAERAVKQEQEKSREIQTQKEQKESMHREEIKKLDDPRLNFTQETAGILRKTDAIGQEEEQTKARTEAQERNKTAQNNLNKETDSGEQSMAKKITTGLKYYVVLNQLRRIYRSLVRTISDFDRAMTTVAMVSSMNREQVWSLAGAYQELGDQVGMAATEVANLSIYFFRQGRSASDALEMTRVAAESARVAAIDATESANYLTSAINGFQLAASDAEGVADRFAALGAASASSYDELARAMSKVAPSAQSAGVDIDHMMGFLAKGIETTREAPQNIGTAFKTVFARMQELTDFGKTLEDGVSVNRIEEALSEVNVQLRDSMGIFRPAQEVINDLGMVWDDLNRNMQAYLAVAFAGIRQQPRFLALMNNYGRTMELVNESQGAAGEMAIQHAAYIEGLEGSVNRLTNAWEKFLNAISDSEGIIAIVDGLRSALGGVTRAIEWYGDGMVVMTTVAVAALGALMISKMHFVRITAQSIQKMTKESALYLSGAKLIKNKAKQRAFENASLLGKITLTMKHNKLLATNFYWNKRNESATKSLAAAKTAAAGATKLWTAAVTMLHKALMSLFTATVVLLILSVAFRGLSKGVEWLVKGGKKLWSWFKSLNDGAEEAAEEVRVLQRELHNLNKEQEQLEDSVDRFKELRNQAELTTEEVKEMSDILHDLSEIEAMGETRDFTMQTAGGRTVFDDEKYENVLEEYEKEQQRIKDQQVKDFRDSLQNDLEGTLEEDDLMQIQRRIMFEAQEVNIKNLEDDLRDSIERTFDDMLLDFEMPINIVPEIGTKFAMVDSDNDDGHTRLKKVLQNEEEIINFFEANYDQLLLTMEQGGIEIADSLEKNTDLFEKALMDGIISQSDLFEALEAQMSDHLFNLAKIRESSLNEYANSDEEGAETMATLHALEEFQKYIDEVEKTSEEAANNLRNIAEQNFVEEMGLQRIMDRYEFEIDTVINWQISGASINELDSFMKKALDKLKTTDLGNYHPATGIIPETGLNTEQDMLDIFGDIDLNSSEGVDNFLKNQVGALEEFFTEEDFESVITDTLNVFTEDLDAAARSVDQISESQKGLYEKQSEYQEQGYLSAEDMLDVARDYGDEGLKAVKNGEDLSFLFDKQLDTEKEKWESQRNLKQGLIDEGKISEENLESTKAEVEAINFMLDHWEEMHALDQKRIANLERIENITSRIGDMHNRMSSLRDMGMEDTGIFKALENQAKRTFDNTISEGLDMVENDFIELQKIEEELSNLGAKKEGNTWLKGESESIDHLIDQWDNALNAASESIDGYIGLYEERASAIEDLYSREKDAVEDRYDTELDLIQKAHDKRWEEVDYQNNLQESNQGILDIRRRMSALSRDGGRDAMLQRREAQEQLREQQRERQREIEDQILDKEQKRLEEAKEKELENLQKEQVEATEGLTDAILELIEKLDEGELDTDDPDEIPQKVQVVNTGKPTPRSQKKKPTSGYAFAESGYIE